MPRELVEAAWCAGLYSEMGVEKGVHMSCLPRPELLGSLLSYTLLQWTWGASLARARRRSLRKGPMTWWKLHSSSFLLKGKNVIFKLGLLCTGKKHML